jgi:hypothetical protein
VAEWLRSGLQNRVRRFNSGRRLHSLRDPVLHFAERLMQVVLHQNERRHHCSVIATIAEQTSRCAYYWARSFPTYRALDRINSGQAAFRYTIIDHSVSAAAATRQYTPISNAGMNHTSLRNSIIDKPVI